MRKASSLVALLAVAVVLVTGWAQVSLAAGGSVSPCWIGSWRRKSWWSGRRPICPREHDTKRGRSSGWKSTWPASCRRHGCQAHTEADKVQRSSLGPGVGAGGHGYLRDDILPERNLKAAFVVRTSPPASRFSPRRRTRRRWATHEDQQSRQGAGHPQGLHSQLFVERVFPKAKLVLTDRLRPGRRHGARRQAQAMVATTRSARSRLSLSRLGAGYAEEPHLVRAARASLTVAIPAGQLSRTWSAPWRRAGRWSCCCRNGSRTLRGSEPPLAACEKAICGDPPLVGTPRARALAAAYLKYAWTHLR